MFPDEVMDSDAVDLITQLLQRDVSLRLGCGVLGDQAIKAHAFFADLGGFDSLLAREVEGDVVYSFHCWFSFRLKTVGLCLCVNSYQRLGCLPWSQLTTFRISEATLVELMEENLVVMVTMKLIWAHRWI